MRSHAYSSISMRAPSAAGAVAMKWSARVRPNSSIDRTPFSFAKANTVFFWVSVGRTSAWSPVVCASVNRPRNAEETLRSRIWCRAVSR
jgi:hypothetical protein